MNVIAPIWILSVLVALATGCCIRDIQSVWRTGSDLQERIATLESREVIAKHAANFWQDRAESLAAQLSQLVDAGPQTDAEDVEEERSGAVYDFVTRERARAFNNDSEKE